MIKLASYTFAWGDTSSELTLCDFIVLSLFFCHSVEIGLCIKKFFVVVVVVYVTGLSLLFP